MAKHAEPRRRPPQLQQAQPDLGVEMSQIDDMRMSMPKRKVISGHEAENQSLLGRKHTCLTSEHRGRPFHPETVDQASTKRLGLADAGEAAVATAVQVAVADVVTVVGVEAEEETADVEVEETAVVAEEARAVSEVGAVIATGSGPDSPE